MLESLNKQKKNEKELNKDHNREEAFTLASPIPPFFL